MTNVQFEMPAERLAQQREKLKARQLAASRLYWVSSLTRHAALGCWLP